MADDPFRPGSEQRPGAAGEGRMEWFRAARFGMFIHWGLYAIPAGRWNGQPVAGIGEWIMYRARIPVAEYEQLAARFNPLQFDADAWVSLAKRAGQKYLTITSKHHDGFCMFDSKLTNYDIVDATPFGRDPMKDLTAACQRHGIKLCFYYSQTQDWHHANGDGNDWDYDEAAKDFDGYVESYVKPQVTEILTNYGPIGMIWFDTPKRMTREQSQALVDLVHQLQPGCVVNGRIGNGLGDYGQSRDNVIPDARVAYDWEVPATINDTWGFKSDDHNWKSVDDLIRKLVDVASKDGNYLLNVGPTAEGVIPRPSAERLEAMGRWLDVNGQSIYGTRAGPLQGLDWARSTRAGDTLYLHVLDWPAGGRLSVPATVHNGRLLADGSDLPTTLGTNGTVISGPAQPPDPIDTVIVCSIGHS
jgi:alpha-L-fucosidase